MFSFNKALNDAHNILKNNLGLLFGIFILNFVISLATNLIPLIGPIANSLIIGPILGMGIAFIILKLIDGQEATFSNLFDKTSLILSFIATKIIVGIIVILGCIVFIIPGIIFSLKYSFVIPIIVEGVTDPFEAMKISAEITKGSRLKLFFIGFAYLGILLLGTLCLLVGLIYAIPLIAISHYCIYRQLRPADLLDTINKPEKLEEIENRFEEPIFDVESGYKDIDFE